MVFSLIFQVQDHIQNLKDEKSVQEHVITTLAVNFCHKPSGYASCQIMLSRMRTLGLYVHKIATLVHILVDISLSVQVIQDL